MPETIHVWTWLRLDEDCKKEKIFTKRYYAFAAKASEKVFVIFVQFWHSAHHFFDLNICQSFSFKSRSRFAFNNGFKEILQEKRHFYNQSTYSLQIMGNWFFIHSCRHPFTTRIMQNTVATVTLFLNILLGNSVFYLF